ncbi:MAG: IS200/IS605 family transposase [Eubacterium sp.]|nr:IS200/IS605 family transposase [Eubacterium sp.]
MERKIDINKQDYNCTGDIVSNIKYEIIFCTRERRKIFKNVKIRDRFMNIMETRLHLYGLIIINMKVCDYYVDLYLRALPDCSPVDAFNIIKKESRIIKDEFPELGNMPNLWTRKSMISTDDISEETKRKYVEGWIK